MSDKTDQRTDYRMLWERDSAALGKCLQDIHTLRAVKEDQRARIAVLERELSDLKQSILDLSHPNMKMLAEVANRETMATAHWKAKAEELLAQRETAYGYASDKGEPPWMK